MMNKVTFECCGLDKENNFLQAPICPCGCGEYMNLILESENDVYDFMCNMIEDNECEHCAIFTVKNNGNVLICEKINGKIQLLKSIGNPREENWKDVISDYQDWLEFHCYGLLEQVDEESYRIVME